MKAFHSLLLACFLVLGFAADSQARQDIMIKNNTGVTINQLGLFHETWNGEADDLLGQNVLPHGGVHSIWIDGSTTGWEIITVDATGTQRNWQGLDFTGVRLMTLQRDGTANLDR